MLRDMSEEAEAPTPHATYDDFLKSARSWMWLARTCSGVWNSVRWDS